MRIEVFDDTQRIEPYQSERITPPSIELDDYMPEDDDELFELNAED